MGETLRQIKDICEKAERGVIGYETAMKQIRILTERYENE